MAGSYTAICKCLNKSYLSVLSAADKGGTSGKNLS